MTTGMNGPVSVSGTHDRGIGGLFNAQVDVRRFEETLCKRLSKLSASTTTGHLRRKTTKWMISLHLLGEDMNLT